MVSYTVFASAPIIRSGFKKSSLMVGGPVTTLYATEVTKPYILHTYNREVMTQLREAIRHKDYLRVRTMVNGISGDQINLNGVEDKYSLTPLMYAAEKGCPYVVKELLKRGANPNVFSVPLRMPHSFLSPLERAAAYGHIDVVRLLIESGTNLMVHGTIALGHAVEQGNKEMVALLLAYKVPINQTVVALNPLVIAVRNKNKIDPSIMVEIITMLCNYGANPVLSITDVDTGEPVSLVQIAQMDEIRTCLLKNILRNNSHNDSDSRITIM